MNRRRLHTLLLWLLPLFAVRAIIPAGFMLSPSAAGLQLTLCTSVAGQTAPPSLTSIQAGHEAHAPHAPVDDLGSTEHEGHQAHERSICPYAIGGTAHAPAVAYVAPAPATTTLIIVFSSDPDLKPAPVLIDRIRGPPLV